MRTLKAEPENLTVGLVGAAAGLTLGLGSSILLGGGWRLPVSWLTGALLAGAGAWIAILNSTRSTARRRLDDSTRQLRRFAETRTQLLEELSEAVLILDGSGRVEYASQRLCDFTGNTALPRQDEPLASLLVAADREEWGRAWEQFRRIHRSESVVRLLSRSWSTGFPVHLRLSRLPEEGSEQDRILVALTDLSEVRRSADELTEAGHRVQTVLAGVSDAFMSTDALGRITYLNYAAEQLLGTPTPAEPIHLSQVLPGGIATPLSEKVLEAFETREPRAILLEHRWQARSFEYRLAPYADGVFVIAVDVTLRRREATHSRIRKGATSALGTSASLRSVWPRLLRGLGEALGWDIGTVWLVDDESSVLRCAAIWNSVARGFPEIEEENRAVTYRSGVALPGRCWAQERGQWIEDSTQENHFPRQAVLAADGLASSLAFPIRASSRTLGVIEFHTRSVTPADGALLELLEAVGSQIGQFLERHRADEARHSAESRYRRLLQGHPSPTAILDGRGAIVEASESFLELFSLPAAELRGARFAAASLVSKSQREEFERVRLECLVPSARGSVEVSALRRDRTQFPAQLQFSSLDARAGLLLLSVEDLSESRALASAVNHPIALVDAKGRFRTVNARFAAWFSEDAAALRGRHAEESAHGELLSVIRRALEPDHSVFSAFDHPLDHPTLGPRHLRVEVLPVSSPSLAGARVVRFRDITDDVRLAGYREIGAALDGLNSEGEDCLSLAREVSRRVVPLLADWCVIALVGGDGQLERTILAHSNPMKTQLLQGVLRHAPLRMSRPDGTRVAGMDGNPELVSRVEAEHAEVGFWDGAHLDTLRRLGICSNLSVPIVSRGQVLGAITLVTAESGRQLSGADQAAVQEIAGRLASAIERSRRSQPLQLRSVTRAG